MVISANIYEVLTVCCFTSCGSQALSSVAESRHRSPARWRLSRLLCARNRALRECRTSQVSIAPSQVPNAADAKGPYPKLASEVPSSGASKSPSNGPQLTPGAVFFLARDGCIARKSCRLNGFACSNGAVHDSLEGRMYAWR